MQIPHFVYRLYDATNTLIYVGMTGSVALRMKQHRADKPWWGDVARVEVDQCADQADAAALEQALIVQHDPPHNTVFATTRPPRAPVAVGPNGRVGRKKSTVRKGNPLQIRLTADEYAEVVADAKSAGFKNLSEYVRFVTLPEYLR